MIAPSFKILDIESPSSLALDGVDLIIKTDGEERRFFLDDLSLLLVSSKKVELPSSLLVELGKRSIPVLIFDKKHHPCSLLLPLLSNSSTSERVYEQIAWRGKAKDKLWKKIVENKLAMQLALLKSIKKTGNLLPLIKEVKDGDPYNLEGQGARIYFPSAFGDGFVRKGHGEKEIDGVNACLNYGYSLILALFLKGVVSLGYITQLGIHHHSKQNPFNLACDLMEPFRPFIDKVILENGYRELNKESKMGLLSSLSSDVGLGEKHYELKEAIYVYCQNAFACLSGKLSAYEKVSF